VKVAVTGATGFIGRHVIAELERRSVSPVLVCREPSAVPAPLTRHRTAHIDIRTPPGDAFEQMGRPDVLIHLAWGGLPNYRSLHHFECELPAQYAFLKRLVGAGLPRLLVTGTCFEYGQQSGALHEGLETRPSNPYGFAKDALRRQLEYLAATTRFTLTWARLFYLYGEGQASESLYPQLKSAVEQGRTEFPMSGGEQLRDFLPVRRAAAILVSLALRDDGAGVVNVCSGTPISVRSLVERWIEQHGWSIALRRGEYPYPDYEPFAFWGSASKLGQVVDEAVDPESFRA
jgi:dTDP-6-deoxy-L-talose 4-dehydrogenase (NAD+)